MQSPDTPTSPTTRDGGVQGAPATDSPHGEQADASSRHSFRRMGRPDDSSWWPLGDDDTSQPHTLDRDNAAVTSSDSPLGGGGDAVAGSAAPRVIAPSDSADAPRPERADDHTVADDPSDLPTAARAAILEADDIQAATTARAADGEGDAAMVERPRADRDSQDVSHASQASYQAAASVPLVTPAEAGAAPVAEPDAEPAAEPVAERAVPRVNPITAAKTAVAAKPKLRGMLHLINTPIVLIGGLILMILANDMGIRIACAIWTLTGLALFGNSAIYHRGKWTAKVEAILRRIDHSNIAIFIAGTYTPLTVAVLQGNSRVILLSVVWGCAIAEVLFRTLWLNAPRALYVALYLAMGWVAVFWLPDFWVDGGPMVVIFLVLGGLAYSIGAVIYALKRPNPSPEWFGFHELFHTGTVVGAVFHWIAILLVV